MIVINTYKHFIMPAMSHTLNTTEAEAWDQYATATLVSPHDTVTYPPTDEHTRDDLVKRILRVTEVLGWTKKYSSHRGENYYWFKKGRDCIPIILEDHAMNKKTKKGYLTTAPWGGDGTMSWGTLTWWSSTNVTNYINNINTLGWGKFGRCHNRKRLDPVTLSMEQIKEVLKRFETIHE
jgi:hypothetical protein